MKIYFIWHSTLMILTHFLYKCGLPFTPRWMQKLAFTEHQYIATEQIKMSTLSHFQAFSHQLRDQFCFPFILHFSPHSFTEMIEATEMFLFTIIMQFCHFRNFLR